MTLRSGHGTGAGKPRIEVSPVDELPVGVPAPSSEWEQAQAPRRAPPKHRLSPEQARENGRLGGIARAAKARELKALEDLGLRGHGPERLRLFLSDAQAFALAEVARLAKTVGGGVCGAAPASMVQSAALQLAGSRAAFAEGDLLLGSRLANDSRQNLLAAHELCAREATARPKRAETPWVVPGEPREAPAINGLALPKAGEA